ncbi:MAG: lysophospholipid acyltransferase family protein [Syntrophobacteraceae bacterium]
MDSETLNIQENSKKRRGIVGYMPFLPVLIAPALRLLHRTCRVMIIGEEHFRAAKGREGPAIAAFWHFAFPSILYFFRDKGYLTIISRSRDGELAARLVKNLGYNPFRGSPGKGGAAALKGIISAFRNSPGGGFVADGSQGPAQIAQKGLLILALHSECPIFPVTVAASSCWRFRSWDRTVLPKPFSKIVFAFGPLIHVEKGAPAQKIEEYRVQLETSLNEITAKAWKAVANDAQI